MDKKNTHSELGQLASIIPGYQFRRGLSKLGPGSDLVIQLKDIGEDQAIKWDALDGIDAAGAREECFAKAEDILFLCRGNNNFPIYINAEPPRTIIPNIFFIIRTTSEKVFPAFLNWYLKQRPARRQIEKCRRGTSISMIPREGLSEVIIPLPALKKQKEIAELGNLIEKESALLTRLNQRKRDLLESLVIERTQILAVGAEK